MTLDRFEHPLAELFDCVEDILAWVKDREGRYRWVNRAFLLNYALDDHRDGAPDVIGKTDYDPSPTFLAALMTSRFWPASGSSTGSSRWASPTVRRSGI